VNAIFLKQVPDSVIKGKLCKLVHNYINNEKYVIDIYISNKAIEIIEMNFKSQESSVIKKQENVTWIKTLYLKYILSNLERSLSKIVSKNKFSGYTVIYSNDLKNNIIIKRYLEGIFNKYSIKEYVSVSTIKSNLNKYIDEYTRKNNLEKENIKPLIIVSNTQSLSLNMVEDLNQIYKQIDIYVHEKARKNFHNKIEKINSECGSCISIINRKEKDLRKYNIYIFVDKSLSEHIKYKFNNKGCFIDFTNKENDKFNDKYIKLENEIKNGKYEASKIKELYELYGKITVSNVILD